MVSVRLIQLCHAITDVRAHIRLDKSIIFFGEYSSFMSRMLNLVGPQ